jgi:hypothetical protein
MHVDVQIVNLSTVFVFTANTEASAAHWLGQKLCAHFSTSANQETKKLCDFVS